YTATARCARSRLSLHDALPISQRTERLRRRVAGAEEVHSSLHVPFGPQLHLQVARAVMAQSRHVPGEAGHEVDLLRVGLEVDEELGLLGRADAGEVSQALIRPVLLALHPADAVPEA